jgi:hypothetical protein
MGSSSQGKKYECKTWRFNIGTCSTHGENYNFIKTFGRKTLMEGDSSET